MDLLATALHPRLYNTSQKKSHLQRYSKMRKKKVTNGYRNTNNVLVDKYIQV